MCVAAVGGRKEGIIMKKFCVKCGKPFDSVGREVICPACKATAAADAKRAAVLKAKRASWTGESVPVRISGRASAVIRKYGEANSLPFAAALDELLKSTLFFADLGVDWKDVTPYKSRRRDKHTMETQDAQTAQDVPQDVTSKPQDVPQAATPATPVKASKASKASKATSSKK